MLIYCCSLSNMCPVLKANARPHGLVYPFVQFCQTWISIVFLEIDGKHRIMNCRKYQYAIVPSHLATHLKVHHPRLTLQQRCNHISKTERCSTLAKIHEEVVYPASDDPPIPSLPIYFDGLKSDWISDRRNACSYVCRDLRLMRKHCKAET
jgi:hypothetical protein